MNLRQRFKWYVTLDQKENTDIDEKHTSRVIRRPEAPMKLRGVKFPFLPFTTTRSRHIGFSEKSQEFLTLPSVGDLRDVSEEKSFVSPLTKKATHVSFHYFINED